MKRTLGFQIICAIIGSIIIVALFPLTMYMGYALARRPKELYIALIAYWGILQPLCTVLFSWLIVSKLTVQTKPIWWVVNAGCMPIATAICFYLFSSIDNGRVILPFSDWKECIWLFWLLLLSSLVVLVRYITTRKKNKEIPQQPEQTA